IPTRSSLLGKKLTSSRTARQAAASLHGVTVKSNITRPHHLLERINAESTVPVPSSAPSSQRVFEEDRPAVRPNFRKARESPRGRDDPIPPGQPSDGAPRRGRRRCV